MTTKQLIRRIESTLAVLTIQAEQHAANSLKPDNETAIGQEGSRWGAAAIRNSVASVQGVLDDAKSLLAMKTASRARRRRSIAMQRQADAVATLKSISTEIESYELTLGVWSRTQVVNGERVRVACRSDRDCSPVKVREPDSACVLCRLNHRHSEESHKFSVECDESSVANRP